LNTVWIHEDFELITNHPINSQPFHKVFLAIQNVANIKY
jgi:hypothetical protein